ncbi:non-oxidative hydroxyarylic acid decarboxylases subunit D [Vibrio barjaei]|uniref:non-oxidative hydroxyarylic acid decarboxylases subunit D n=1 Tax=Vibrio barjaei TaxID=1676683 RepID=UPI0007BB174B|nr:non-oxidative hydroxyarylic acid decarboxylases subunit D [Vibrio barjaei]OIN23875.1 hypothetical protein AWH66_2001810 [Vibrio barjaei]
MNCPRCNNSDTEKLVDAPKDNIWSITKCNHCLYTWRNTESEELTDNSAYPDIFKLNDDIIENMKVSPPLAKR